MGGHEAVVDLLLASPDIDVNKRLVRAVRSPAMVLTVRNVPKCQKCLGL